MAPSPARSPATRERQRTHDDEISRAMDKAMRARSETFEQFARRFPTATSPGSLSGGGVPPSELRDIMRDADDDELARYAIDRARIDAELARLNGPAIPDPNKTDEEFEAELAQFRAFAEKFGAFTKAFDEDGIPRGDRAGSFADAAGGSADDANAKMVAEFKAAVMKGDADYGATGSRDDDPRVVRARVEGADGDGDGDSNPERRSAFAVDRNGALLTVDAASSSRSSFRPFDPNEPPSDLDTEDVSEGDAPFFLESPKMAKFDNWVPEEESEEESEEEESEGSKPASSSDDSDDDSEHEDDVEAAAMEEEKRLKAEMVPILGGSRGSGGAKPRLKGYGSTSPAAPAFADAVASPAAPLRPLTTVTGGYGSGGVSPSAEAAASRTSPFVTVKGDAHDDDDDDDEDEEEEEDEDEDEEGRASSGMLKRARRRLRGPGRWAVDDDDAEDAKAKADEKSKPNPAVGVDLVMFKIKCGKCAATLKIPAGVDVFRCPKCAAKLRVPVASGGASGGASAGKPEKEKEKEPPARTSPGRAAKELSEVAKATRDVIDRHRTERAREARREALGESRAELVRHVEFSKSLEDVIDEMCRQVSARTGVAAGA